MRWHAVIGGLLVAVILACPVLCRAGVCCSAHPAASTAEDVDEQACPHCQQEQQARRSRVPPLAPRKPACQCSAATVPVIVSAPELWEAAKLHVVGQELRSGNLFLPQRNQAAEDMVLRAMWGRGLCVAHGVLIC